MYITGNKLKIITVKVISPKIHREEALQDFEETENLIKTLGGVIVAKQIQHKVKPNPAYYLGSGKAESLKGSIKEFDADIVLLDDVVNTGQIFRLEKLLWEEKEEIKVWDRVDLILNIFQKHSRTNEANLQIELAKLMHLGPRIYGLGETYFSRQAGGIGTRGIGETNIETMRRHIKERIRQIKRKLEKEEKLKVSNINQRKIRGVKTLSLAGYTNAGKTSLFNLFTGKDKAVQNSLFTTLDSVLGKLSQGKQDNIVVSDTIGFIKNLPPFLISAFKSTLLESINADVILHIADGSDGQIEEKINEVDGIIDKTEACGKRLLVINKSDLLTNDRKLELTEKFTCPVVFVSAKTGKGIEGLLKAVHSLLSGKKLEAFGNPVELDIS